MSVEKLKNMEVGYDTESITIHNQAVWPVIRLKINECIRSEEGIVSRSFNIRSNINYNSFKTLFFGFRHLLKFRKYKYWFFSSSDRRKKVNGIYEDRVIEGLIGESDRLVFENPYPLGKHYPINSLGKINIISQSPFYLGEIIFSKLFRIKSKIQNEQVLKTIVDDYGLSFNYKICIQKYWGQYLFYKTILRFHKPKVVFLVYSASSMGMIKALKERNIPVVELQHGIINEKHLAYNVFKDFGNFFYPDYLMTYGEKELEVFHEENYFITPKNVIPVGYYFLERSRKIKKPENKYLGYNKIVVFSFQEVFENQTFDFLNDAASLDPSICYVIIPRNVNNSYKQIKLMPNIFIEREINIYDALKICDIHATINSSCAIEALTFGVPSILYNYDNWSSSYFKSIFGIDGSGYYVKTPEKFIEVIKKNNFASSKQIMKNGETFFKKDFLENFGKLLNQRIKKKQNFEN
ncbi:hypothetical protein [Aquimarina sp. LLG6339-5]|uniref:hypothetical protein n=1 Tax=Aquimarina sp. LLG6339-5 TaxID=3160830 RepID=UPI003868C582